MLSRCSYIIPPCNVESIPERKANEYFLLLVFYIKKERNQPYLLFTPALDINLSLASNISLTSYMCDLCFFLT